MSDQIRHTQIEVDIVDLLKMAIERDASDLLVTVGLPPMLRINGEWGPSEHDKLTPNLTRRLMYSMMDEKKQRNYEETKDLDFSFSLSGFGRFRVNVFQQRGSVGGVMRTISEDVLSFAELGLPDVIANVARLPRGLVLVTGPTGSGKSTTLATMVDLINEEYPKHIVTVEDPIEFFHQHKTSIVNQREIGEDTKGFHAALRSVLRQAPDVILVGEMRDPESAKAAMEASSSGRVLLSTLHSRDTAGVVSSLRYWDIPDHEIATNLELVVAQRLVRRLCRECSRCEAPTPYEIAWLKSLGQSVPHKTWHATGCRACFQTGYQGRTGVFEIWRKDEHDYQLILSHTDEGTLRRSLRERGRKSLLQDGLTKAFSGITSLEEIQFMNFQTHMLTVATPKRNAKASSAKEKGKPKSKTKSAHTSSLLRKNSQ
jgi:pilus retraction protein PilT